MARLREVQSRVMSKQAAWIWIFTFGLRQNV